MNNKYKYEHLLNRVPNNLLTRWIVRKLNKMMGKSESRYRLSVRYRCPKTGNQYGRFGQLSRTDAKRFAIYIRNKK